MAYDFSKLKEELQDVEQWLQKEFQNIRTGRATPALLDGVTVDSYGTKSPVQHVASITTEGPRSLRVVPWDKGQIKEIEKAIVAANLGISVSSDDTGLRVSFPELNSERRDMLKKLVSDKIEHAKVSMRQAREKTWNDIQTKEKDGDISEDEKYRLKEDLQKLVDETGKKFDSMGEKKDKEIME